MQYIRHPLTFSEQIDPLLHCGITGDNETITQSGPISILTIHGDAMYLTDVCLS